MARPKKVVEKDTVYANKKVEEPKMAMTTFPEEECGECKCERVKVNPILQEFGNGELNILRDKLNEIIKAL